MTIQDIKTRLNREHPHQYDDAALFAWINDVERDIAMFFRPFEGVVTEDAEQHTALTDEVMLNEPDIYVEYLISKIALANEEYDRYNAHAALFDARYTEWKERYIRSHEPINRGTYKI